MAGKRDIEGVDLRVEWDKDDNEWNINLSIRGSRWKTLAQTGFRHNDTTDARESLAFMCDRIIRHIERQEELLSIMPPSEDPENLPDQLDE